MNNKLKLKKIVLALFLASLNTKFSYSQFEDYGDDQDGILTQQDEDEAEENEESLSLDEIEEAKDPSIITKNVKLVVGGLSIVATAAILTLFQRSRMSPKVKYNLKSIQDAATLTTMLDSFAQGENPLLKKTEEGRYLPIEQVSSESTGFLGAATKAQKGEWLLEDVKARCYEGLKNSLATVPSRIEMINSIPDVQDRKSLFEIEVFSKVELFVDKVKFYAKAFAMPAKDQVAYLKDLVIKVIEPVIAKQTTDGIINSSKNFTILKKSTEDLIKRLEATPTPQPAPAPSDRSTIHVIIKKGQFEAANTADKGSVDKFNDKLKSLSDSDALNLIKKHFYYINSYYNKCWYRKHYFSENEVTFTGDIVMINDVQAQTILKYYKSLGS